MSRHGVLIWTPREKEEDMQVATRTYEYQVWVAKTRNEGKDDEYVEDIMVANGEVKSKTAPSKAELVFKHHAELVEHKIVNPDTEVEVRISDPFAKR